MSINGSEQLTKADIKRIEDEIEHRKMVVRPAALRALKDARALGDLSENFEYHVAKRENNMNNSRIRYLEKILRYAVVIEEDEDENRVGMNNTITVYFEEEDETETFRIVTSIRSDSRRGLISNESPLGKAMMGHAVGDRIEVRADGIEPYHIIIRSLDKTGESDDDAIHQY